MTGMPVSAQIAFFARCLWTTYGRGQTSRTTEAVRSEYDPGWASYTTHLLNTDRIDSWLRIPGVEDERGYCNVGGRVEFEAFDSNDFNRNALLTALKSSFPEAKSITEFGCGIGRNILFLRERLNVSCYGYELCEPGVAIAKAAAEKFKVDVKYAQLDYVKDPARKYVFPKSDVAFTMFSLEQIPHDCDKALKNILDNVNLGSIHIEPVPENYPHSPRGLLGRLEHSKIDYLRGFDAAVRRLGLKSVSVSRLDSAHNPLMFPSLYVLKKA